MATDTDTLQRAVQTALSSFLQERISEDVGDIAQDVYRAIRDEASLLLERQLICDALDSDPFRLMRVSSDQEEGEQFAGDDGTKEEEQDADADELAEKKKNAEVIARVKDLLRVISCTRTTTAEGYSSIHCVVQLTNDGKMQGVKDHIRLHFTYSREPQHHGSADDGMDGGNANKVIYADADDFFRDDEDNSSSDEDEETNINNGKQKQKAKNDEEEQPNKKRKRIDKDNDESAHENDETDDEISGSGRSSDMQDNLKDSNNNNEKFTPKTIVTYKIDYSIDHGKMERLLGVDIYALGEHPSIEEAVPILSEEGSENAEEVDTESMDIPENGEEKSECNKEKIKCDGKSPCCDNGNNEMNGCNKEKNECNKEKNECNSKTPSCCDGKKEKNGCNKEKNGCDGEKQCHDNGNSNGNKCNSKKPSRTDDDDGDDAAEFEEIEMSDHSSSVRNDDDDDTMEDNNDNGGGGDRFGVFVNPENIVDFLDRANVNLNEQTVFHFLLTCPFYEHEWDICGFILSALFDDEEEEEEEDEMDVAICMR